MPLNASTVAILLKYDINTRNRTAMQKDALTRILCNTLNIRAYTVQSLAAVREITAVHDTDPVSSLILGRAVNAAALLSSSLKPESHQNLSVKFTGTGIIKEINVQADAQGNLRAYISHNMEAAESPDHEPSSLIENGFLTVTKDIGLKEPYRHVSPLRYGDIARDIVYYLTSSEQVPSAMILGVSSDDAEGISASGGILIQTFPETPPESTAIIEKNIERLDTPLGDYLISGNDINSYLAEILGGEPCEVIDTMSLRFACRCSHDLTKNIIMSIPSEELIAMANEDKGAQVVCTFCRKEYSFGENELRELIRQ